MRYGVMKADLKMQFAVFVLRTQRFGSVEQGGC